jgi:hypothetical protein
VDNHGLPEPLSLSRPLSPFSRLSRPQSPRLRTPQDGSVNEAGLQLVIDEEKAAGKLPSGFSMEEILVDRFVKDAAQSVNQRFGSGCE